MIFSSYPFLLVFLPLVLMAYTLHVRGWVTSPLWQHALIVASLVFYSLWDWHHLFVLAGSIGSNFLIGRQLFLTHNRKLLGFGIALNLAMLAWFKYRFFFAEIFKPLIFPDWLQESYRLALPLGISFFTFQQIAWLVDLYKQEIALPKFKEYLFFVTFFPQLIAGPIVHAREIMPQIRGHWPPFRITLFASGVLLFCIGLAKKVIIADNLNTPVGEVYAQAAAASAPLSGEAPWLAAFGYGLQLYFDFSGYADMAIGLGLMVGLKLPMNFNSPYKSRSIIEFWRRWHMTLSHFLRDYLYIPLGGHRHRYRNLLLTMLLGGLWHGAGWQFIVWGGIHGLALGVAHGWRQWLGNTLPWIISLPLTLGLVMLAWIPFRADSLSSAWALYRALFNTWQLSLTLPSLEGGSILLSGAHGQLVGLIGLGLVLALYFPNSHSIVAYFRNRLASGNARKATHHLLILGTISGALFFIILKQLYNQPDQAFIYFNF